MMKTLLLGPSGSLVNRILSHLVAVLLSLHMLLGCCWHHAHACSSACQTAATAACGHADGDDDDGHCQHSSGSRPGHHPTDACTGERCSFVASPKTASVGPQVDAPSLGVWSLVSLELPAVDSASAGQCARVAAAPPERLHLVYQVLRI